LSNSAIADVGTTPLKIELPCCFRDLTISKRGFDPWTATVRNHGHANVTAHLKRREISASQTHQLRSSPKAIIVAGNEHNNR
jgi:hypothetical protein